MELILATVVKVALPLLFVAVVAWLAHRSGRTQARLEQARNDAAANAEEAQRWADRPRDRTDLADNLRAVAKAKRDRS